ncbi:hypothetical protein, variant [Aphanomyces astaci]|uniref:VPS9 domain-containing protein n=1 Tax=Aphanomyces astaci TaxID=112090 RepID=W4FKL0_APHAT|nr:hypothetical protein, variant [Aphanomyces astaci]ETV68015.1 hypothetical protein, variant [Aphanomyces astaci]|eukprot:XP_009842577.1 hypothetical protein, variant [Aphanomyces astaci]
MFSMWSTAAAGGTAAAATTNPFLAAVELHFPLLLRHVINLNPPRTDTPPSSIKFLVCVPQSLSLLTSDVTLADLYSHVLVADAAVGQYQTLDGTYVAIAGSYLLTKPGLDSHPGRTVRIVMTDAYSHPAMTPPDAYQCMILHINRPLVGGVAVPEDMGEMDRATFRRYIAMIRAYPESAPVFSSIDVFVQDLLSSRKPPQHYLTPRRLRHVWTTCVNLLDDNGTLDTDAALLIAAHSQHRQIQLAQAVESYLMEQVHDVAFSAVVARCRSKDDAVHTAWRRLEMATPQDFNISREFQCEQRQAIDLIAHTHIHCHTPLAMLMQLKRALTCLNEAISRHLARHRRVAAPPKQQLLSTDDVLDQLLYILVQVSKQRPAFPLAAIISYIEDYHFVNSSVSALGFALANFQVALEWFTSSHSPIAPLGRVAMPVSIQGKQSYLASFTRDAATSSSCCHVLGSAASFHDHPFHFPHTIRHVACGARWFGVVTDNGHLFTWGDASGGRLGVADRNNMQVPTRVPQLSHVVQVSCGGWHVLACDLHGHVYSWGMNANGQLGHAAPSDDSIATPVLIDALCGVYISAVACGAVHSLAVTSSGQVYSWGSNRFDQLGQRDVDDTVSQAIPRRIEQDWGGRNRRFERRHVPLDGGGGLDTRPGAAMQVAAGTNHSMVISRDGALFVWGCGHTGQLGLGSYMDVSVPTQVLTRSFYPNLDL